MPDTPVDYSAALFGVLQGDSSNSHPLSEQAIELLRVIAFGRIVHGRCLLVDPPVARADVGGKATGGGSLDFGVNVTASALIRPEDLRPVEADIRFEIQTDRGTAKLTVQWLGEATESPFKGLVRWERPCRVLMPGSPDSAQWPLVVKLCGVLGGFLHEANLTVIEAGSETARARVRTVDLGRLIPGATTRTRLLAAAPTCDCGRPSHRWQLNPGPGMATPDNLLISEMRVIDEGALGASIEVTPGTGSGKIELDIVLMASDGVGEGVCAQWRALGWAVGSSREVPR